MTVDKFIVFLIFLLFFFGWYSLFNQTFEVKRGYDFSQVKAAFLKSDN